MFSDTVDKKKKHWTESLYHKQASSILCNLLTVKSEKQGIEYL